MPEPDFDKRGGLVPAIAQDVRTGQVLMVAYMNREAWRHTVATGKATYWSTSRNALWVKGESSGHVQHVRELLVDCDADAVLLRVEQMGGVALDAGIPGRGGVGEAEAGVGGAGELFSWKTSPRPPRGVGVGGGEPRVGKPGARRGKRTAPEVGGYPRRWFAERNVDVHIE